VRKGEDERVRERVERQVRRERPSDGNPERGGAERHEKHACQRDDQHRVDRRAGQDDAQVNRELAGRDRPFFAADPSSDCEHRGKESDPGDERHDLPPRCYPPRDGLCARDERSVNGNDANDGARRDGGEQEPATVCRPSDPGPVVRGIGGAPVARYSPRRCFDEPAREGASIGGEQRR